METHTCTSFISSCLHLFQHIRSNKAHNSPHSIPGSINLLRVSAPNLHHRNNAMSNVRYVATINSQICQLVTILGEQHIIIIKMQSEDLIADNTLRNGPLRRVFISFCVCFAGFPPAPIPPVPNEHGCEPRAANSFHYCKPPEVLRGQRGEMHRRGGAPTSV